MRSGNSFGQGWIFTNDGETCWVATTGHVIIDGAGVLVAGETGEQGEDVRVHRHPGRDFALVEIFGALAKTCPFSPRGDRDSMRVARGLQREGRIISFERRTGANDGGGAFGLEIIPIRIIGLSESDHYFTATAIGGEQVIEGDSGGPVRSTGTGIGEAGWPIGLVLADKDAHESDLIEILPMDVVRVFHDSLVANATVSPTIRTEPDSVSFTIEAFTGETPDTACATSNLLDPLARCGWRAHQGPQSKRASLTLALDQPINLSVIEFKFAEAESLSLVGVRTKIGDGTWGSSRPCYKAEGATSISGTFGDWSSDTLFLEFEGHSFELKSVHIN